MTRRFTATVAIAVIAASTVIAQDEHAAAHDSSNPSSVRASPLPGASLYQLPVRFTTAHGSTLQLIQYRGQPLVVTLFYGTCKAACPLLTRAMTQTAAALPLESRDKVHFLMVTLDPQRDTTAELARFAQEHALAAPRFEVARTDADGVRLLAASLGIRYRQLPDGNFSHSAILTVLDSGGVPQARTEKLAAADPDLVAAITRLTR
jgi:protein SCO1/2